MTHEATHGRFGAFVDSVQAVYPSTADATVDPEWLCGQEHVHANHNWHRVVAWFDRVPSIKPGGVQASRNGHDATIAARIVRAHFTIWGRTARIVENMVHAMIGAIDSDAGPSAWAVANMSEDWAATGGDIVSGGVVCDLTFDLGINVLESDAAVILTDADPGDGTPPEPATELVLGSALDGASLPDVTTTED